MRFLVHNKFREQVIEWINANHLPGKRSNWFPMYHMKSDGTPAIMANIEPEDAVIFALTFEHEKMDKE